jgi:SpoVK/Ycf46/Vps4 family AAA+-type ATPase
VQVKTEFMQLWDGLLPTSRIIVVGATNQPNRLNDAIWRRFGVHFEVRSP